METWNTAGYLRLSREDGDKAESDSIANQRKLLEQYLAARPELHLVCAFALGYAAEDPAPRPRKALEELLLAPEREQ